jgi:cystathionine beta-lyase/cystathionine gamma-synthase
MRFDTKLVQLGQRPGERAGDVVPPIHLSTTYDRRAQDPHRYFYGRGENPTREDLELCLAGLEDAPMASVFSSGQAAAATVLSLLSPGDRLIASDDVYGGTYGLFTRLGRYGIAVEHVDLTDPAAVDRAFATDVAMVWIETPTNPLLKIADLAAVCPRARAHGARVVVDNTFAGPALQQPLRLGADVSLYSTTKCVAGHSDVLGGALVYADEELHEAFRAYRTTAGNVPGAFDCYLVHRGLKTLSLRTARQVDNARRIALALDASERAGRVRYPGLAGHPQHEVAARQMSAPGSILSFEYLGDPERLMNRVRFFSCAVSLGGVRSLIECPATMTHAAVPREIRLRLGVTDNLVRVSAGIEDPADLIEDLLTAMEGQ